MGILSVLAKGLDYFSAPLSKPKIFFSQGPSAAAKAVKTSRSNIDQGDFREAGKVIATTLSSASSVAGIVLGASKLPRAIKSVRGVRAVKSIKSTSKKVAVASVKSPTVRKVAAVAGVAAVAAPETFKAIISRPKVAKVAIAGAVNPVLGVAAAVEQGTNLVKESAEANQTLSTVGKIAGVGAAAGLGLYGASKLKGKAESALKGAVLGKTKPPEQINATVPKTPATEEVVPITEDKPKAKDPQVPKINQSFTFNLTNKQTKRIINGVSLSV